MTHNHRKHKKAFALYAESSDTYADGTPVDANQQEEEAKAELAKALPQSLTDELAGAASDAVEFVQLLGENVQQKFNPYHDRYGRFASGGGLGLAAPGQPALPGMGGFELVDPNALVQPALMARLKVGGYYTDLVAVPGSAKGDGAYTFPIDAIQANMKAGDYSPLGDNSEGDNPRFTTTVNGQDFFVKRLEGRVAGGDAEDFINHELAARAAAVDLGLADVTIPVSTFSMKMKAEDMYDDYGNVNTAHTYKFLTQPMIKNDGNGFDFEDSGGSLDDIVQAIPKERLSQMVAYEYLMGTADRHWGQYLIDAEAPPPKRVILNDFDYGFPTHSGKDSTPYLWSTTEESPNFTFDRKSLEAMYTRKDAVLKSVESYLDQSKYNALEARFELLHDFSQAIADGKHGIEDFTDYINSNSTYY